MGPQSRPLRFINCPGDYQLSEEQSIYERGLYIGSLKNLDIIYRTPYHNEDDEVVENLLRDMDREPKGVCTH